MFSVKDCLGISAGFFKGLYLTKKIRNKRFHLIQ